MGQIYKAILCLQTTTTKPILFTKPTQHKPTTRVNIYHICEEIQGMKMLTLSGGLSCVGFINPVDVPVDVRGQRLALPIGPN
jgi:hypothetical protein